MKEQMKDLRSYQSHQKGYPPDFQALYLQLIEAGRRLLSPEDQTHYLAHHYSMAKWRRMDIYQEKGERERGSAGRAASGCSWILRPVLRKMGIYGMMRT